MDQCTEYKKSEFYCTKSGFVEPTCKKFSKWKNKEKLVKYIKHNNAPENKVLIKIANDSQWKLGVTVKYTRKGMPQRNQLAKLGFADIDGKARAMMVQANLPEEIKYKLCKEYFNCAMNLSNLVIMTLNGKKVTKQFYEAKSCYAKHLRIRGEAGTVSMRNNRNVENRRINFLNYAKRHAGHCFLMYNPTNGCMIETRDITWLHCIYYGNPEARDKVVVYP